MKDIPVGRYVTIRKTSKYYGADPNTNPAGKRGVVVRVPVGYGPMTHSVKWLHSGVINIYCREDLRYWDERKDGKGRAEEVKKAPKKKPTLEELVADAEAQCRKAGVEKTARYAFIFEESVEVNTNTACHAQVINYHIVNDKAPEYILTYFHETAHLQRNAVSAYGKWLVQESPWKDVFVNKDVYSPDSFLLCTTDIHGPVLQGALVASRQPYEHPERIELWHKFVLAGLDGRTAFCLASCLFKKGGELITSFHDGGHYPVDSLSFDFKGFINFECDKEAPTFRQTMRTDGCHRLFGRFGSGTAIKTLFGKVAKGKGEATNNPFKKAKKVARDVAEFSALVSYVKENGL